AALPPQNGSRGYDHEGLPPPGPDPGQPDPEEAIHRAKLGPRLRPPVHGELVAQGQVLEGELAVAAAEEREKSKQVEQEDDHRAEILSGSAPTDQQLAAGRGLLRKSRPEGTSRSRRGFEDHAIPLTLQELNGAMADALRMATLVVVGPRLLVGGVALQQIIRSHQPSHAPRRRPPSYGRDAASRADTGPRRRPSSSGCRRPARPE